MSIIIGGLTLGTVVGVRVGTTIGQHISWKAGLVFVAAVDVTALLGNLAVLPAQPIPPAVPLQHFTVLTDRRVVAHFALDHQVPAQLRRGADETRASGLRSDRRPTAEGAGSQ